MKQQDLHITVVGATGSVGQQLLEILHERTFPLQSLTLLASERSAGQTLLFGNRKVTVQSLAGFNFEGVDIAFFCAGKAVAKEHAPRAAQAGAIVIDNSSCFRYDNDVPLVVPEVNGHCLASLPPRGIIGNPNCSTAQLVVPLKPIYDQVGIERINVATYQAVSGTGQAAIESLATQTARLLSGQAVENTVYPQQIAFNVLPHIDRFESNGYTFEEMKMYHETQKIFEDDQLLVNATAVRVPVFYGHSEAVHLETREKITAQEVVTLLSQTEGVSVFEGEHYPTPIMDAAGKDAVCVGRIREDISHPRGLNLWIVADNIRKGAALNAIQIAETYLNYHIDI